MLAILARILPLTTVLTLLIACSPDTRATEPVPTATWVTLSDTDRAVANVCFPMITGTGEFSDADMQAVYLSDPKGLTRYVAISTTVIKTVQGIVERGEPIPRADVNKLYAACKAWHDADYAAAFKKGDTR